MFPHMTVTGEACPMWVPLVENNEFDSPGADYFVRKHFGTYFGCRSGDRYARLGLHALSVADRKDQGIPA